MHVYTITDINNEITDHLFRIKFDVNFRNEGSILNSNIFPFLHFQYLYLKSLGRLQNVNEHLSFFSFASQNRYF